MPYKRKLIWKMKYRLLIDVLLKYIVLLAFTSYIGIYIYFLIKEGREINMPDWIVMLYTMVFTYFFRKSPKEGKNGNQASGDWEDIGRVV